MTEKQLREQISKLENQLETKKTELKNITTPCSLKYRMEYHYNSENVRVRNHVSYYADEQSAKKAISEKIRQAKVFSQYHATGCAYLTIEYKVKGDVVLYEHYMFVMGEQQ